MLYFEIPRPRPFPMECSLSSLYIIIYSAYCGYVTNFIFLWSVWIKRKLNENHNFVIHWVLTYALKKIILYVSKYIPL